MTFRDENPVAWAYHRRTSRWPFNMHGLNDNTHETPLFKEDFEAEVVRLDPPVVPVASLAELLSHRGSCRQFTPEPISATELGTLLYAGYGVTANIELGGEFCARPVPSGGGLYPLELYALAQQVDGLEGGVYHYVPLGHLLELVRPDALPRLISSEMFLGQPYLVDAAALIVITAVVKRSLWKYEDRGYRYILLESGHVAQNVNLCAEAMDLGSLNLGGFLDEDVMSLLDLDQEQEIVVYGVAVGKPATTDRVERRYPGDADKSFRRF